MVGTRRAAAGLSREVLPSMVFSRCIDILLWVYVELVAVGAFFNESEARRPVGIRKPQKEKMALYFFG